MVKLEVRGKESQFLLRFPVNYPSLWANSQECCFEKGDDI